MGLVPGLIVEPVVVDGVPLDLQPPLLAVVQGQPADVGDLLGVVGYHRDLGGLAEIHEPLYLFSDVGVAEGL